MTEKTQDWEKAGAITVDAGIVWLGDPCYIVGTESSGGWPTWQDFCSELFKKMDPEQGVRHAQYEHKSGVQGKGVCVEAGYGDGTYEVMVRRNGSGRIAEARILFTHPEHDGPAWMSAEDWLGFTEKHLSPDPEDD